MSVCEACGGGLAGPGPHVDSLLSPAGTADISAFQSQGKHESLELLDLHVDTLKDTL